MSNSYRGYKLTLKGYQMNMKIDFVILWVDGSDKNWLAEKNKYSKDKIDVTNSAIRYRDWDNLRYWFRGVEKFAPWVNKIHFVTYGHLPKWLNVNNPKLNIVKHEDYIPKEYLPTFSSHAIELNLHRIETLSENFVYFNDDMFLINKVDEKDFFVNEVPRDSFSENALTTAGKNDIFPHILLNNMDLINKNFDKKKVMKSNLFKYINPKYGNKNFRTLALCIWSKYSMIYDMHLPTAYCKDTFRQVWDKEYEILNATSKNKFRTKDDVNQYVFRYWQLLNGSFIPRNFNFGRHFTLKQENREIYDTIKQQKNKMICINDGEDVDFEKVKNELIEAFDKILPEKSEFEI